MSIKRYFLSFCTLCLLWTGGAICTACQSDEEKHGVIDLDKMSDVLYDYQVARSLGEEMADSLPGKTVEYKLAVFHKYGLTEQQFNHSLAYYSRHTDKMKRLYARIEEKYSKTSTTDDILSGTNSTTAKNDTTLLWKRERLLLNAATRNSAIFTWKANTPLHKGDGLSLRCNTAWLVARGVRQGVGIISARLANDSVKSVAQGFFAYQNNQQVQWIYDSDSPVRSVTIQFYLGTDEQDYPQVLSLTDLRLVVVHRHQAASVKK